MLENNGKKSKNKYEYEALLVWMQQEFCELHQRNMRFFVGYIQYGEPANLLTT